MNVLFATTVLPSARLTGGERASLAFVEGMREAGHRVRVVGYRRPGVATEGAVDEIAVGTRSIETRGAGPRAAVWLASALGSGRPYSVAKYRSRAYRRALRSALASEPPDLVVIDHAQIAPALEGIPPEIPAVLLAHNVEHRLYEDAGSDTRGPLGWLNRREARAIAAVERAAAQRVQRVWALTSTDAEAFADRAAARAFSLPVEDPPEPRAPRRDIGLLGTWTWEANAAGLSWFLDSVVPLLPDGLSIAVAGAGAERWADRGGGVRLLGRVPDARAFLASCRVVAVPATAGAGVQVKTLDAIASGRPVVATPLALRGIDDAPAGIAVTMDAPGFADALSEALQGDPSRVALDAARGWTERRRRDFRAALASELAALEESTVARGPAAGLRCAYLVSRYPYLSHTFIRREIEALRALGAMVATVTVRRPDAAEVISSADRDELSRTFAIRPVSPGSLARDHLRAGAAGVGAYLATLRSTLRDTPGGLRGAIWQLFYFVQGVRLWAHLAERGVDHVHVHHANVAADLAMVAAELAARTGGPLRWSMTVHGPADIDDAEAHKLALKSARADAVVAISEYARRRIDALVDDGASAPRVSVIHCGIDPDEFDSRPPPARAGELRVLSVARLERRKGVAGLLEAVAAVRRDDLNIRLTIVGDGPERGELERLRTALGLEPAVELTGALAPAQVAERYGEVDAFCLPSSAEGVPIVLMEAMAARLPVIATSVAGVPELVADGESGLLVPPGDPAALAAALRRLADEPGLRSRLGEAGRSVVLERFTILESARRITALFTELANVTPGRGSG